MSGIHRPSVLGASAFSSGIHVGVKQQKETKKTAKLRDQIDNCAKEDAPMQDVTCWNQPAPDCGDQIAMLNVRRLCNCIKKQIG